MTGGASGPAAACAHCGSPVRANAPFCGACGQAIATRQVATPGRATKLPAPLPDSPPTSDAAPTSRVIGADRRVRYAACLLDVAVLASPAVPLALIAAVLSVAAVVYVVTPAAVLAAWLWTVTWQGLTGQTFGKAMLGLRVVRAADHRPPGFTRGALRGLLFALSAGLAALPVAANAAPRDGWHDRLSGISVIDISIGANPLGPRQRTALRARIDRGLKQVNSPIPKPGAYVSPHFTTGRA